MARGRVTRSASTRDKPIEGNGGVGVGQASGKRGTKEPGPKQRPKKMAVEVLAAAGHPSPAPGGDGVVAGQGVGAATAGPGGEEGVGVGLSQYELDRLERIKYNRQRLAELQLVEAAQELANDVMPKPAARPARPKGVGTKRRAPATEPLPRRASLRQRGLSAQGGVVQEERANGTVITVEGEKIRTYGKGGDVHESSAVQRHSKEDLPFRSTNNSGDDDDGTSHDSDATFLQHLTGLASAPAIGTGGQEEGEEGGSRAPGLAELRAATLNEEDVAKVTPAGIAHIQFLPTMESILLAAGDKQGNVGLWRMQRQPGEGGDEAILCCQPHSQYVCGLRWVGGGADIAGGGGGGGGHYPPSLITASYDGSVRRLDAGSGRWLLLHGHDAEEYSAMETSADGRTVYLGDVDGGLTILDTRQAPDTNRAHSSKPPAAAAAAAAPAAAGSTRRRAATRSSSSPAAAAASPDTPGKPSDNAGAAAAGNRSAAAAGPSAPASVSAEMMLSERKVNTLCLDPAALHCLAAATGDGGISLWDVRQLKSGAAPLAVARHTRTCQSAYFAPDGSHRLLSTSRDNTVRVWDGDAARVSAGKTGKAAGELRQLASLRHDNETGRYIMPFRAAWSPSADCAVVGSMRRAVDLLPIPRDGGLQGGKAGQSAGAATSPTAGAQLASELLTAIPPRSAVHPGMALLAAATGSGRVHVFRA